MNKDLYKRKYITPFFYIVNILIIVNVLIFLTEEVPSLSISWKILSILLLAQGVFLLRLFLSVIFHFFRKN